MDEEKLTEFWLENYLAPDTLCALCGNNGVIVTVDRGAHWCICPNGRAMAKGRLTSRAADFREQYPKAANASR